MQSALQTKRFRQRAGHQRSRRWRHHRPCAVREPEQGAIRSQLIVGGYIMVGAIPTNKSLVTLEQITIAWALPANMKPSSFRLLPTSRTLATLPRSSRPIRAGFRAAAPQAVQTTSPQAFAKAAGVDPTRSTTFSGGGARRWRPFSAPGDRRHFRLR